MSITLGSYSALPNTLNADGCRRESVDTTRQWVMADGSLVRHSVSSRWRWQLSWDVDATDYSNLSAAYVAAVSASKTFKPPDTATTWTVLASGWRETAYSVKAGTLRYKVSFTVEETTA